MKCLKDMDAQVGKCLVYIICYTIKEKKKNIYIQIMEYMIFERGKKNERN